MTNSSPLRWRTETPTKPTTPGWRQQQQQQDGGGFPMSDPPEVSDFLQSARNSPEAHRRNLEVAQRQHRRVLDAALHVFDLHQLAEAQREIEVEEERRRQRVAEESRRIEKERQAKIKQLEDEARLAAQKAKPIPKPVVELPPSPPAPQQQQQQQQQLQKPQPAAAAAAATLSQPAAAPTPAQSLPQSQPQQQPQQPPFLDAKTAAKNSISKLLNGSPSLAPPLSQASSSPLQPAKPTAPATAAAATPPTAQTQTPAAAVAAASASSGTTPSAVAPSPADDRYLLVHKNIKALRKHVVATVKPDANLRRRVADLRRDITKSFGQLTSGGLKENKVPVNRLITVLQAGLKEVPSELVDPNQFLIEPRLQPVEGAAHNDPQLPSLFLYLLSIFAKAAINQFIGESGADTHTAEAIGQAVVKVLSEADFVWRGKTMIDILIAKFRVVCPVLFGFRGNDKTQAGRHQVGWKQDDGGHWISEQYHADRMTGLGAGFAAITLRDFSRVSRVCPWPPTAYWTAMAAIVATPPAEMSDTQCYVLKAMIESNEARFMGFYGTAAVAALRCALVDFPDRIPKKSPASQALKVLAKVVAKNTGLDLEHP